MSLIGRQSFHVADKGAPALAENGWAWPFATTSILRNHVDNERIVPEYKPQSIEKKWQERWRAVRAFEVSEDPDRPKFYCLEMFACQSGHAHVGHVRNYMIGDVVARMKRMRGFNVLHPFGWDAFGMPAENAAIKNGSHTEKWTLENIEHMKGQLQRLGISYARWCSSGPATGPPLTSRTACPLGASPTPADRRRLRR